MSINILWKRARFLHALRSRPFMFLWSGQAVSSLGDGAFQIAQVWQVLLLTGSAAMLGVVLIAETIPLLLFLLIGGVVADRFPRRFVMISSDSIRAVVVLITAGLSWLHLLQIWHLVVLSLIFGLVRGFFRPAYKSLQVEVVEKQDLPSANSLSDLGTQMRQLLGPMLGATCIALAGPAGAFAFDGLTFTISVLCLIAVRVPVQQHIQVSNKPECALPLPNDSHPLVWKIELKKFVQDTAEGLQYVVTSKWLWVSILIACVFNIGWMGPLFVTLPRLVLDIYHAGSWLIALLLTANAIGAIFASFAVAQMPHLRRRGLISYLALILPSTGLMVLGLPLPLAIAPWIALLALIWVGLGLGVFNIIWSTVLQEMVPNDKYGRVSSIDALSSFSLLPLGYALIGILTDSIGPTWVFLACGICNFLLVLVGLSVREIRHMH